MRHIRRTVRFTAPLVAAIVWALAVATVSARRAAGSLDAPTAATAAGARSEWQTAPAPPSSGAPQPAPLPTASGYVGDDTCLLCHDAQRGVWKTPHGLKANPRTPAAQQGCESCHGPGQAHVDDDAKGHIRKFAQLDPREANAACLSCHERGAHALWQGSPHDARRLACGTCHSVHTPKGPAQLKVATESETCANCHRPQAMKMNRSSHMPVREGKMSCASCHNPHGATNVKLLKTGNWINESCVSCHTEKRGPFLFEHAAGRESCVSCHEPHGSSNERMLVAKLPMLCQRCHIGTRHPSTIYDGAALAARSNRLIGRGCVQCHSNIHGSNHPSGGTFLR